MGFCLFLMGNVQTNLDFMGSKWIGVKLEYSQPCLCLTAVFSAWHSLCGAGNSFRDVMLLHRSLRNSPSHSLVEVGGDL